MKILLNMIAIAAAVTIAVSALGFLKIKEALDCLEN